MSSSLCISNSHFQSSSSNSNSNPNSPPHPSSLKSAGAGYIEHAVTKYDTLAGVAIKYGVEVVDIRKMNGLVTDHQMFALRFLHIPLPGRHPPSPCLSTASPGNQCSDRSPRVTPRKASQAMNSLQSYYGLKARSQNSIKREILEMALCKKEGSHYLEDRSSPGASSSSRHPFSPSRRSRSLVKLDENSELSDSMPSKESIECDSDQLGKRIRRRQKSEADFQRTPEMLLEDNTGSGRISATAITGKCLALRPKAAANRTADVENTGGLNPIPVGLASDGSGVRKSSSTSNLQDHDSSCAGSIWSTSKWRIMKNQICRIMTLAVLDQSGQHLNGV